ncbi:MAG TPA: POTRA domain-containing protein, partial [Abditibacteriaceae bacterium]|nr:POTRA domain-containing protein [Abditibacteriaceae bacterium]
MDPTPAGAAPSARAAVIIARPQTESVRPRPDRLGSDRLSLVRLRSGLRLAQTDTNKPAAEPKENPPGLIVPVVPDKSPPPEPKAPKPDAPAAPATSSTPATPNAAEVLPPAVTPGEPTPGEREAEGREVVNVRVVGNRVVPTDTILLQAATKQGVAYAPSQIQLDLAKIDTLGFFASVKHQVTPNLEDPTKVDVTFIVVENRVITGFRFEGSAVVKSADLLKALQSRVGTVLNRNIVNADITKIQDIYRERGYGALVENVRQAENGTVIFTVQEAKVCRVELAGLRKTKPDLVRKQIRTKAGDPFDTARIRKDLNRIYDMGFFEDVNYKIENDPDQAGCLIVTIGLKEKRTGSLSLGVGFDSRSKISGFVTVSENNFRGTGKTASASVELGSQRTYELGFSNPFVGRNNASYGASIYKRRVFREPRVVQIIDPTAPDTALFEEQRQGARLNYTHPLDQDHVSSLLFGFRNEKAQLFQTDVDNTNPTPLGPDSGRISALSLGFLHDGRDLRLDP